MFRNLTIFRFSDSFAGTIREIASRTEINSGESLQGMLSELAAKPCGPLELHSRGWVSPYGPDSDAMFAQVGDSILLALGGEDKVLPASAVNAAVAKRVAEVEQRDGRKLPRRTRNALRDDILAELLPRALVKPYRLQGYIDLRRGLVVVDTASRKAAEGFVSELRAALGTFPALPLNAEQPPRAVLTDWLIGDLPEGRYNGDEPIGGALHLDDSATLEDGAYSGGSVKLNRLEIGEEIGTHLEAGMQCTRLGLTLDDHLSFTFDEDLAIRKLKFLDGAMDNLESFDADGLSAEIDARFSLLTGEVGALFDVLEGPLKFSTVEN